MDKDVDDLPQKVEPSVQNNKIRQERHKIFRKKSDIIKFIKSDCESIENTSEALKAIPRTS